MRAPISARHRSGAGRAQQRRHRHRAGEAPGAGGIARSPTTSGCPASSSTTSSWRRIKCRRPRRPTIRPFQARYSEPLASFAAAELGIRKVDRPPRRAGDPEGLAVNLGFGISANVPRILIEEGLHGEVTWVIEQGAVGGVPLLDFQFGCAANAEAIVPSPHQFTYFQGAGFDASLLSFLQIDQSRIGQRLEAWRPAACDGRGRRLRRHHGAGPQDRVLGLLQCRGQAADRATAGSVIEQEGKVKKLVPEVEHVSFSGRRGGGARPGRHLCHRALRAEARARRESTVTEIAPGIDLERDVLAQAGFSAASCRRDLQVMEAALFKPEPFGLSCGRGHA